MATFNLQDWDRTGKLSPYKTSVGTQALEGVTGLMAMLQQQQQDKALRQAAGQMMGGQAVPQGVNAGDLYSKLAVEQSKNQTPYANDPLKQIELENVLQGFRKATEPTVADTLGAAVPQQTPGAAVLGAGQDTGIPPMFVPGKKNKYGIPEEIENPAYALYQKTQEQNASPLSGEAANRYAGAIQGITNIGNIKSMLGIKETPTGVTASPDSRDLVRQANLVSEATLSKPVPFIPGLQGAYKAFKMIRTSPKGVQLENYFNTLAENVLRARTGAAAPDPEVVREQARTYLKNFQENPEVWAQKMNQDLQYLSTTAKEIRPNRKIDTTIPVNNNFQSGNQKKSINDLGAAALATGAGAAGLGGLAYGASKVIPKVAEGVKHIPTVMSTAKEAEFAKSMNKAFTQEHTKQVAKFGSALDKLAIKNPQASIDLSEFVSEIIKPDSTINPQAMAVFKKVPKLADMMANPELAKTVSIRDAQDIINYLNTKVPKNIKVNNFDLLDAINTVKAEQLQAFPEMAKVRARYAKFIEPYKNIKRYFGFNKTLPAIKGEVPFGGAQGWEAAKEILPAKTIKSMKGFRMASQVKEGVTAPGKTIGKMLGIGGKVLSAGPSLLQAFILKKQFEESQKKGGFRIGNLGDIIPTSKEDLMI